MKKLEYTVRFNTPAFLGNAEQQAQWRTPPFKALIRQWWRVVYAADHYYRVNVNEMRTEEGLLFGHAWLENDHDEEGRQVAARKSLVRMRLEKWDIGKLKSWDGLEQGTVYHPETEKTGHKVGPHAYLGFGPLDGRGGTKLSKTNAAIQFGETAILAIAFPTMHRDPELKQLLETNAPRLERALWLMDRYGTLGGRSRNGWGSFALLPLPLGEGRGEGAALAGSTPLRLWSDCLSLDWPHALGRDGKGALVWQTAPHTDWKSLMRELAIAKIGLRAQFVFTTGNNAPNPEARHWLSHPITKHNVGPWHQARLPNSLRFKVRALPDGKLAGVIFHVPCSPPKEFNPNAIAIRETWQRVHALLDECTQPSNQRAYASIADAARRNQLKSQLDSLTLRRIPE